VYRPFQFQKRTQLFITTHNETPSVAAMCVYDEAGNVIETHEHKGDKTLYHI
jgi:hypothetical protein